MMSTKMICGCVSAIFANASKPSVAVTTSQPSRLSSVSAVLRMVFESSMTITLSPASSPPAAMFSVITFPRARDASALVRRRCESVSISHHAAVIKGVLPKPSRERLPGTGPARNCAKREDRRTLRSAAPGRQYGRIAATISACPPGCDHAVERHRGDGCHRPHQDRQGHHLRHAAGSPAPWPRPSLRQPRRAGAARRGGGGPYRAAAGAR
ncbi:hypothetical protein D9M71_576190 [compost metagenome]